MLKLFQRLIVAALCLLALVLSSELLTQIWPGVRLVPSVQAQDAAAPFVLKQVARSCFPRSAAFGPDE